jgi:hypothetical protein
MLYRFGSRTAVKGLASLVAMRCDSVLPEGSCGPGGRLDLEIAMQWVFLR